MLYSPVLQKQQRFKWKIKKAILKKIALLLAGWPRQESSPERTVRYGRGTIGYGAMVVLTSLSSNFWEDDILNLIIAIPH